MIGAAWVLATSGDGSTWTVIAGRLHPALAQLPTGLLVSIVALELWGLLRKRPLERATRRLLASLVAVTLALAAGTGWEISGSESYDPGRLRLHLVVGAVFTVMGAVMLGTTLVSWRSAYVKALVVTVLLALPVGWMGGELTHGAGFPLGPSGETGAAAAVPGAPDPAAGAPSSPLPLSSAAPAASPPVRLTPDADAVEALRAVQAHVEVLDPATGLLWIDLGAVAETSDGELARHLAPLADVVADLSLARSPAAGESVALIASMDRLERLDLSHSAIPADAARVLSAAPRLASLNLTGTATDDDSLDALADLPTLRELFLFATPVTADGVARFLARRPEVRVVADTVPTAEVLEVESPPVLLSRAEADLAPVNMTCPVSGGPVDARFLLVHDGRVVGFCCADCPSTFWADPTAFPVDE